MKLNRTICVLLTLAAVLCCVSPAAMAAHGSEEDTIGVYATSTIRFDVQPNTFAQSSTTIPLDVGDTVVIKAAYTPFSADVDVGIIDTNGTFYYVEVVGGSIDITIDITLRGNYRIAIRNNSSNLISVSGHVNY